MSFRELHEQGCFVIPNPWDRGTAIALAAMGFPALATTSAGVSFAQGLPDTPSALGVDAALRNIAEIVDAVELPVNADFQAGYADDLDGLAANVRRCVATGVAGLSIEDARGGAEDPLYSLPEAVERIRVAVSAIDGADVLLTARAECFLYGHPDPLREAITRLQAFAEAGADVLYAPGVRTTRGHRRHRRRAPAVTGQRVDVVRHGADGERPRGARCPANQRRLCADRVAWGAFLSAARRIAEDGSFAGLADTANFEELNGLFGTPRTR